MTSAEQTADPAVLASAAAAQSELAGQRIELKNQLTSLLTTSVLHKLEKMERSNDIRRFFLFFFFQDNDPAQARRPPEGSIGKGWNMHMQKHLVR